MGPKLLEVNVPVKERKVQLAEKLLDTLRTEQET